MLCLSLLIAVFTAIDMVSLVEASPLTGVRVRPSNDDPSTSLIASWDEQSSEYKIHLFWTGLQNGKYISSNRKRSALIPDLTPGRSYIVTVTKVKVGISEADNVANHSVSTVGITKPHPPKSVKLDVNNLLLVMTVGLPKFSDSQFNNLRYAVTTRYPVGKQDHVFNETYSLKSATADADYVNETNKNITVLEEATPGVKYTVEVFLQTIREYNGETFSSESLPAYSNDTITIPPLALLNPSVTVHKNTEEITVSWGFQSEEPHFDSIIMRVSSYESDNTNSASLFNKTISKLDVDGEYVLGSDERKQVQSAIRYKFALSTKSFDTESEEVVTYFRHEPCHQADCSKGCAIKADKAECTCPALMVLAADETTCECPAEMKPGDDLDTCVTPTEKKPCELADCSNGCVNNADKAECTCPALMVLAADETTCECPADMKPGDDLDTCVPHTEKSNPGMVGIILGIIIGLLVALACLYLILKAYNNKKVKVELDKDEKVVKVAKEAKVATDAKDEKNPDVEHTAVYTRQMMQPPSGTSENAQPPTPIGEAWVSPSADVKEGGAGIISTGDVDKEEIKEGKYIVTIKQKNKRRRTVEQQP